MFRYIYEMLKIHIERGGEINTEELAILTGKNQLPNSFSEFIKFLKK